MDTPTKAKKVLSKDQVALLVDLIQNNPILTSRETNAATNRCKEDTWITLASTFNARSGSVPRTKEQLKLKWDNLKKAARKRSQQIRMNSLKTGGGKPDYIPPDDILEKVSGLLGATCTGFAGPFGGDGVDVFNIGNLPEDVVNENVPALDVEVSTSNELPTFCINEEVSGETPGEGIVNRGDSFRRRRSRSGSLAPASPAQTAPETTERRPVALHRVAMVGAPGVGKTALISQFQTSECINAYDRQRDIDSSEQKVSIMLNGEESELYFVNCTTAKEEIERSEPPDAFVVMYSVVDKASFQKAEQELARLLDSDMLRSRPAVLVGNKIDLARSRAVSTQDGKCQACTYKAKFMEVSVGINHNVDELLVGILNQIRLKKQQYSAEGGKDSSPAHWYKSRGVVRASMKARQMFTWIFGKEDSKFKNCENLHVL